MKQLFLKSAIIAFTLFATATVSAAIVTISFTGESTSADFAYDTELNTYDDREATEVSTTLNYGGNSYSYDDAVKGILDYSGDGFHGSDILKVGVAQSFFSNSTQTDALAAMTFDGEFYLDNATSW